MKHLDKIKHALVGGALFIGVTLVISPFAGLVVATIAGASKEVYDNANKEKHTPELLDFLATVAPAYVMYLIAIAI